MGEGRGRWGRRGEAISLARLVGGHGNAVAQRWRTVAGDTLVGQTWCLGVRDGALRVIAANEAIRQELLDRSVHVVAAWNMSRGGGESQPATELACWVGSGRTGRSSPSVRAPSRPACDPVDRKRATGEMAEVRAPEVRRALVEARARSLARDRRGEDDG